MPEKAVLKKRKTALKRARQAEARTLRNSSTRKLLKTLSKKIETALDDKNVEGAKLALSSAVRSIDKAASKGIIHRNTASRKVSRLTKRVNSRLHAGAI